MLKGHRLAICVASLLRAQGAEGLGQLLMGRHRGQDAVHPTDEPAEHWPQPHEHVHQHHQASSIHLEAQHADQEDHRDHPRCSNGIERRREGTKVHILQLRIPEGTADVPEERLVLLLNSVGPHFLHTLELAE